jgi:hypothetical protein
VTTQAKRRYSFPFAEVSKRIYRGVAPELRAIWKKLREKAERYSFGRTELLPIKQNGVGCAVYLTKYLGKALVSDKSEGEEKCRLFGIWGRVRFVHSQFDWVSNRIIRKRKAWLAADSGLKSEDEFKMMFGPHWWRFLGKDLLNVIMPVEYYQVQQDGRLVFDELGWWHYQSDRQKFAEIGDDEHAIDHSRYLLYFAHGMMLYGNPVQASRSAYGRLGLNPPAEIPFDPEMLFRLEAAIERTKKNNSP